jgi:hypothetical protein
VKSWRGGALSMSMQRVRARASYRERLTDARLVAAR